MKLLYEDDDVPEVSNKDKDFTGQRFGKWTLIERVHGTMYIVQCDCGRTNKRLIAALQSLRSSQCKMCYKTSKKGMWTW